MSNTTTRIATRFTPLTALLVALAAVPAGPAQAQVGACGEKRDVQQGALNEQTYRQLEQAYELVGEERYNDAYEIFTRLKGRANGDYVQSILSQALGQTEWARGNYDAALREMERAVELNGLPDETHYALMYQIAQLYFMQERLDDALAALDLWFCKVPEEKRVDTAYVLKASILAQKEDWGGVVEAIDQAISLGDAPREDWYRLKLAALFELERYPEAAETLEILVAGWPDKKDYWLQLSNIYIQLQDNAKALSVSALAYRRGMMTTQADILLLANLYAMQDVPYKAAQVLQKGLEDGIVEGSERYWTLAGDTWYSAEEFDRALGAFQQAGAAADDGEIDLRRGYLLVDMERWDEASQALSNALEKGGLNDTETGRAYLMLGMTQFNLGNYDQASTNWGRAGRYDSTRDAAQQWMNHLRQERARQAAAS
ncbi:tetratricopeptide repeat protein [Marinihelvus fidelis]|uniref:Tetratricopeptide repeat protein n=1 Tax=Marinihelvus fidelis TaxID=2613842 RepID=A0A5N0T6Z6_9GAMM|nr:tetratricopeptide repeat protein [Marinihelvus fidelis]KAA9130780.1 tetratricopeptide repeat protein [Marinihelvus fidelis]